MSNQALVATLEEFSRRAETSPLTFGEALDTLDEAAYALIALILVLPFLQPIPLGPLTVIGGITFAALGWQMWRGHESPVLPLRIRQVEISAKVWGVLAKVCAKVMLFCQRFCKSRHTYLVSGRRGQKTGGLVLISGGLLMAIPFGVLPLNNMLPGFAIVFYCIGELENDGLMLFISFFWLAFTTVYFGLFFFALYYLGTEAVMRFLGNI